MAGINKTLYNKVEKNQTEVYYTKEEVMDILRIKDSRTFYKLIKKEKMPHIIMGNRYLIPVSEYNKWAKKKIV